MKNWYFDYFGKKKAEQFGDLIVNSLSGKYVSKKIVCGNNPGGLIYEANKLGISKYDLLEALEGLCYQGRAVEVDDSTYFINEV